MIDNRLLANLQEIDNYTITIIIIFSKLKENQLLNSWFKKLKINKTYFKDKLQKNKINKMNDNSSEIIIIN